MNKQLRLLLAAFALACTTLHAAAPVVLLRSDTTAAFFVANGGDYERILTPWRSFFARHGIKAREMQAGELASLRQPAVLVLASTVALGNAERDAIRARLAAGWSVLGTWALGVRDGKGTWIGYDFIDEVFAARVAPDLGPGTDERFLLPFGETPLTHALHAGKRIYLMPTSEPLLRVQARNAAARYGNYMREATQPGALLAAAAFDERDGARRAYFGFAETSWDTAQADLDKMLRGALDWLRRKPIVMKSAWPHPHQAAVLLEMDTEDRFENSVRFAQVLERFGHRGTFYSLTSEAVRHPNVVKRLASRHEIAYHAEVHTGFAKLPRKQQDERLQAMIRQMATLLPDVGVATGFRAPLEEYDATTEQVLRAQGLRHHAASPDARDDALPGFSSAEPGLPFDKALVVLPRTWHDDITLFTSGLLKGTPAEKMLLASLQDTVAMRSFGLLSLHTQQFYAGSVMERATPRLLQSIAAHKDEVWVAPGEDIARWWREREAVQLVAREQNGGLAIQLKAARPVKRLRLVLIAPSADSQPRLQAGVARLEKLDAYRWAIVLPDLLAGEGELRVAF
jgi:peptidoglycan/xylan/chitin deacetylase (PgdA/CDA1 family)